MNVLFLIMALYGGKHCFFKLFSKLFSFMTLCPHQLAVICHNSAELLRKKVFLVKINSLPMNEDIYSNKLEFKKVHTRERLRK